MSGYPSEDAPMLRASDPEKKYPPPGQHHITDQPPPYAPPQGAPPQGYPPQGPPPQGYPPQGPPPQGYPPQVPPPQGYPAQGYPAQGYPAQAPTSTTVIVQPGVVVAHTTQYGDIPVNVICPNCHSNVTTSMEFTSGALTWILVCVMLLIGCWPCCLIPFCVDGCKDITHSCPACQKTLGFYKRM